MARVRWLRAQVETAVNEMGSVAPGTPQVGTVSATAFGNTAGSELCYAAWWDTANEAEKASRYLRLSLDGDAHRLDAIMYAFTRTDAESADRITATMMRSHTLGVFNTHLDSKSGQRREQQLDRSVDYVGSSSGPAIFTGDFNTETPDVDPLLGHGWVDASKDAAGNPVPTEGSRAIDKAYVGPGVVVTGPARTVEGDPSDHEGLVVDVGVLPGWP